MSENGVYMGILSKWLYDAVCLLGKWRTNQPMNFQTQYSNIFQHIPTSWCSRLGMSCLVTPGATGLERGKEEAEAGRPALPVCVCQYSSKDLPVRGTAKDNNWYGKGLSCSKNMQEPHSFCRLLWVCCGEFNAFLFCHVGSFVLLGNVPILSDFVIRTVSGGKFTAWKIRTQRKAWQTPQKRISPGQHLDSSLGRESVGTEWHWCVWEILGCHSPWTLRKFEKSEPSDLASKADDSLPLFERYQGMLLGAESSEYISSASSARLAALWNPCHTQRWGLDDNSLLTSTVLVVLVMLMLSLYHCLVAFHSEVHAAQRGRRWGCASLGQDAAWQQWMPWIAMAGCTFQQVQPGQYSPISFCS